MPFAEPDGLPFVGREKDVRRILTILREHQLVVRVGASGEGKTSLLRTRLIPALRRGENVGFRHGHDLQLGPTPLKRSAEAISGNDAAQRNRLGPKSSICATTRFSRDA
jgi:hypothetical protein